MWNGSRLVYYDAVCRGLEIVVHPYDSPTCTLIVALQPCVNCGQEVVIARHNSAITLQVLLRSEVAVDQVVGCHVLFPVVDKSPTHIRLTGHL